MYSDLELQKKIPYFDMLFDQFEKGNQVLEDAFGQHVHWGYWENPSTPDLTPSGYHRAAERLSVLVSESAHIQSGQSVLDVGCGFGGTLGVINNNFERMKLVGLNIDARQIERARNHVPSKNTNIISFVVEDACELNFAKNEFHAILAVECIHHFSSRLRFFEKAASVMKPGGKLVLTDFLLNPYTYLLHKGLEKVFSKSLQKLYGTFTTVTFGRYEQISNRTGLKLIEYVDITKNTSPSMDYLKENVSPVPGQGLSTEIATRWYELATRLGLMKYALLAFEKS